MSRIGWALALGIWVSAIPKMIEKKISPSMSIRAIVSTMLRGTMLTKVLIPKSTPPPTRWAASPPYWASRSARTAGSIRRPGAITFISVRPMVAAAAVVRKKKPKALPPTRPIFLRSPSEATPRVTEPKISGMTIMNSMRRKTCPTGLATLSTSHISHGAPGNQSLPVMPAAAPMPRPSRILVWSWAVRHRPTANASIAKSARATRSRAAIAQNLRPARRYNQRPPLKKVAPAPASSGPIATERFGE